MYTPTATSAESCRCCWCVHLLSTSADQLWKKWVVRIFICRINIMFIQLQIYIVITSLVPEQCEKASIRPTATSSSSGRRGGGCCWAEWGLFTLFRNKWGNHYVYLQLEKHNIYPADKDSQEEEEEVLVGRIEAFSHWSAWEKCW